MRKLITAVTVLAASTTQGDPGFCGDPAAGECCVATGKPGCTDDTCCNLVCDVDPFCCVIGWDGSCANHAIDLCEACQQPGACCLADGSCLDVSGLFECNTLAGEFGVATSCDDVTSGIIAVPNDFATIQQAIDAACLGAEIVVAPGTYFETINLRGKAIRLHSSDGPDVTTIDGTGFFHVVQCVSGEGPDTVIDGFTITGGNATGSSPDNGGGGMYNVSSSPTVINCTFSGNMATSSGGGMLNNQSNPTVTNCIFSGNTAGLSGGGMTNTAGNPTVTNCSFSGNSASFCGGGMYNSGSNVMVTNCTFSGNTAGSRGGGICSVNISNPTVTNCSFSGNTAGISGGGMYNSGTTGGNPTVTDCAFSENTASDGGGMYNQTSHPMVTDCTFTGNTATDGGGLFNSAGSSPRMTDCTFTGNSAAVGGGGMHNNFSFPTVINCTFTGNSAGNGGAMWNDLNSNPPVADCTFTQNTADNGGAIFGNTGTFANCIVWDNNSGGVDEIDGAPTVTYSDVLGGFAGMGNINLNPMFVDADAGDLHLSAGSPCIDAAHNIGVPSWITTDLDGNPRFVDDLNTPDCPQAPATCGDQPVVDMGAYEFQRGPPCPWNCDADNDGDVGIIDLQALVAQWGGPGPCDFDGGGTGIIDFLELLANWGPCP